MKKILPMLLTLCITLALHAQPIKPDIYAGPIG